MVKLGLTPEGNWTFYYFCNKVRRFNLRTNFMAIIASFTNIRSSCIATLNTFYERKKKKLFCWTIIFVERQANNFNTPAKESKEQEREGKKERRKKQKNKKPLRKAKQNLKIYLDNILNNLRLHTKTNILDSCVKDSFCFLAAHKQRSQCARHLRGLLCSAAGQTLNYAVNLNITVKYEVHKEEDSC